MRVLACIACLACNMKGFARETHSIFNLVLKESNVILKSKSESESENHHHFKIEI